MNPDRELNHAEWLSCRRLLHKRVPLSDIAERLSITVDRVKHIAHEIEKEPKK